MTEQSTCAAEGCGASCQRGQLMCKACWFSVPTPKRKAVNAAWRAYRRPADRMATLMAIQTYLAAREAAIAAAKAARP
jgi:hypothetical protein